MTFTARPCSSRDLGPGISVVTRRGTLSRSTFAQPISMPAPGDAAFRAACANAIVMPP